MNNIWTTVLLVIACLVGGYFLGKFVWGAFEWIGFLVAFVVIGMYIFGRNRRIQ